MYGATDRGTGDLELALAWGRGDLRAGDRLTERYSTNIRRFFFNKTLGSTEDLVQDTFLGCSRSIARFEGRSSFRSYLFSIARKVLYRHYRDRDVGFDPLTSSIAEVVSLDFEQPSPIEQLLDHEEKDRVLLALRTLPLREQVLVELAYWEELSNRELAEIMDIPMGTIKSRLRKARAELRSLVAR
ncbi:MAG: sigma-70 family RNA polymerase sigma factor [Deltaproteobacteria bacterium]|nr:sigma-70 family RNA polymerase sigma factor [Deltaproteobacteria bacterium]